MTSLHPLQLISGAPPPAMLTGSLSDHGPDRAAYSSL